MTLTWCMVSTDGKKKRVLSVCVRHCAEDITSNLFIITTLKVKTFVILIFTR